MSSSNEADATANGTYQAWGTSRLEATFTTARASTVTAMGDQPREVAMSDDGTSEAAPPSTDAAATHPPPRRSSPMPTATASSTSCAPSASWW